MKEELVTYLRGVYKNIIKSSVVAKELHFVD